MRSGPSDRVRARRWLTVLLLLAAPVLMGKFDDVNSGGCIGGCNCGLSDRDPATTWSLSWLSDPFEFPLADGTAGRRFRLTIQASRDPVELDVYYFHLTAIVNRPKLLAACDACDLCDQCGDGDLHCGCPFAEIFEVLASKDDQPLTPWITSCHQSYSNRKMYDFCAENPDECGCGEEVSQYDLGAAVFDQPCDAEGCRLELEFQLNPFYPSGEAFYAFWNDEEELREYSSEAVGPVKLSFGAVMQGPLPEPQDLDISFLVEPLQ